MPLGRPSLIFLALGPLTVLADGVELPLGGARPRAILALLLLNLNQVVPIDRIVDEVWAEAAPPTVRAQVHANISRLRRLLQRSKAEIRTHEAGYLLRADPAQFDVTVFDQHVREGRRLLAAGIPAAAADRLDAALRLWRGTPFGGVEQRVTAPEVARLLQVRLDAVQARSEAYLRLGRGPEVLAKLAAAVTEHPLREDLRRLLMLAHYQGGGRADALEAFRDGRRVLREELGLDPGPELVAIHEAILRDEPSLNRIYRRPVTTGRRAPDFPTGTPAQLPAADGHFTGRATQLALLDGLVQPASVDLEGGGVASGAARRSAGEPVVALISGPAGIGKTELAVHWAQRVRASFPDGQLHLDFAAARDQGGWTPAQAVAQLLRDLGVPTERLPTDRRAAEGLYRTLMADRACLMLLDNPPSSQHVRALIPASGRSVFIVTTRIRRTALPTYHSVRSIHLGALDPAEAAELLGRLVGAQRLAREPAATGRLVELCGGWPLALRIAASRLADQPWLTVTGLVEEVAADGLRALQIEDRSLPAALLATSRSLGPAALGLLRLLARTTPYTGLDTRTVVATAGLDERAVRSLLGQLVAEGLLQQRDGRGWTVPHLVRLWALRADQEAIPPVARLVLPDQAPHRSSAAVAPVITGPTANRNTAVDDR